uniref:Putative virion glycoprotein N-terminal domain-containing protein n=1 Tax=Allermuir Hill virus 3 TaxID=2511029 RepID=A0A411D3A9_9VIRU|nr:hypothetical protein [Allermuir Hill virus 3]
MEFNWFFYFLVCNVHAMHRVVNRMEVWVGVEPRDGFYQLSTVPFDKLTRQSIRFKHFSIGPFNFDFNVEKTFKHIAVVTDITSRCIQAFSSNIFTGSCDLHPMCVGVESKEIEHTWYGSKVTFCAGHDSQTESRIIEKEISIGHVQSSNPIMIPDGMAYLYNDRGLIAVPKIYTQIEFTNYSLIDVVKPRGDWHTVTYNAYPLRDWYQMSRRAFVTYAQYDPKSTFSFTCGNVYRNFTDYGNKYDSPDCGSIVPITSEFGVCSNARLQSSRRCPLDYLMRKLSSEPFEKLVYIKSSKASWIESLIESLFKVLADITRPIIEEIIRTLINLLGDIIEAFSNVLVDIEPIIENLILNLTKVLKSLLPIIIRVTISILKAMGEVFRTVNEEYILFEISLILLLLSLKFRLLTMFIIIVYILYYFGFERDGNYIALSQNYYQLLNFNNNNSYGN